MCRSKSGSRSVIRCGGYAKLADQALDRLCLNFCDLYASDGRPLVPREQLLLASLLQVFYVIRSERLLLEQLYYNLLVRWFVCLSPDAPI